MLPWKYGEKINPTNEYISKWTENNQILQNNKIAGITSYLSTLLLNASGLNSPIKRHRIGGCIKKQDPAICCIQEIHPTYKKINTGLG
jgi:hypothetical protein